MPFRLKKVAEGRKVGRASKRKKKRAPSLVKSVDPPLTCMTEALLVSANICMQLTSADRGKKAGLASRNIVHLQKNHPTWCRLLLLYFSFYM